MPLFFNLPEKGHFAGSPLGLNVRFVEPKLGQSMKDAIAETHFAMKLWFEIRQAMWKVVQQQFDYMESVQNQTGEDCTEEDLEQFQAALEILRAAKQDLEKGYPLIEFMEVERRYSSYLDSPELQSLPNYKAPVMQYKYHTHLNISGKLQ